MDVINVESGGATACAEVLEDDGMRGGVGVSVQVDGASCVSGFGNNGLGVGLNYGLLSAPKETLHTHLNIVMTSTSMCLYSAIHVLAHVVGNLELAKEALEDMRRTAKEVQVKAKKARR